MNNAITDGEICFLRPDGITDFSEVQAAMKGGQTDRLVYFAFDALYSDDRDLRAKPLLRSCCDGLSRVLSNSKSQRPRSHSQSLGSRAG